MVLVGNESFLVESNGVGQSTLFEFIDEFQLELLKPGKDISDIDGGWEQEPLFLDAP